MLKQLLLKQNNQIALGVCIIAYFILQIVFR